MADKKIEPLPAKHENPNRLANKIHIFGIVFGIFIGLIFGCILVLSFEKLFGHTSCSVPIGFTCNEFGILREGRVFLDIGQVNNRSINITSFGCNYTSADIKEWHQLGTNSVWLSMGRHDVLLNGSGLGGRNYEFSQCCPSKSGSSCKARMAFSYTMAGSSLTRTAYGEISGPVP